MDSTQTKIPVFKLYGEQVNWSAPDLLHCESIHQRSSLYQWEIKPHRHSDLFQLLYLQQGKAQVNMENSAYCLTEPSIQVAPPFCVHGFQFNTDVQGYVLSLAMPLMTNLEKALGFSLSQQGHAVCHTVQTDRSWLDQLFATLFYEYQAQEPARDLQLQALVTQLLIWLVRRTRHTEDSSKQALSNHYYLKQFMHQVEQKYRMQPNVEDLAHSVGLSAAYLNTLCRSLTGQTALQILHQRLLLEAKRCLVYTQITVTGLADELGFADPAYFARFFRRLTGVSPSQFRQTANRGGSLNKENTGPLDFKN